MEMLRIYPSVRPLDPVYLDLLSKRLPEETLKKLRAAIQKYNEICVAAANELNDFCMNELNLPPEDAMNMKKP